jgi:hypothetical protein
VLTGRHIGGRQTWSVSTWHLASAVHGMGEYVRIHRGSPVSRGASSAGARARSGVHTSDRICLRPDSAPHAPTPHRRTTEHAVGAGVV